MGRALSADVSNAVRPSRRASSPAANVAVHTIRVPHRNGEINLVVQVLETGRADAHVDDEQTSVHQLMPSRRSQEFETADSQSRGFVLAPGGRVGKYELREKLGQGTFGLVFVARDTDLERDVAIKILNPSHQTNSEIQHRFLQEAKASARILHPGIVTVLDCGNVNTAFGDSAFIVLELLQGESLTSRLTRSGKLAPATAVEVARQIASALDAAHRADVLHRDLKPDNVYLVPDPAVPSGERVKVLDFGLARIGASKHTLMNTVFGTPRYMSPEQCRSAALIDSRSDIYSLGCILFELVTGRAPFDGDLRTIIQSHLRALPPRARQLSPEVSPELDELIAQMLAKDPNARPQSMADVQAALQSHGAVSPGVAATMMPVAANLMMLPFPDDPAASGLLIIPPEGSGPNQAPPVARTTAKPTRSVKKPSRKGPIAAAAIAFFVAAAITAVAVRSHTRSAAAEPAPSITPLSEKLTSIPLTKP
jgi:serine/threonine protein kinase